MNETFFTDLLRQSGSLRESTMISFCCISFESQHGDSVDHVWPPMVMTSFCESVVVLGARIQTTRKKDFQWPKAKTMKIIRGLELVKTISCSRGLHEHMISTKGDSSTIMCSLYSPCAEGCLEKALLLSFWNLRKLPSIGIWTHSKLGQPSYPKSEWHEMLGRGNQNFHIWPICKSRELKHTCVSQEGTSERQPRLSCEG